MTVLDGTAWSSSLIRVSFYGYLLLAVSVLLSLICRRGLKMRRPWLVLALSSVLTWLITSGYLIYTGDWRNEVLYTGNFYLLSLIPILGLFIAQYIGLKIYRWLGLKWWMVVVPVVFLGVFIPKESFRVDYFYLQSDDFKCRCLGHEFEITPVIDGKVFYCMGIPYACEPFDD